MENIEIFRSYRTSDAHDAESHFLAHYPQFQLSLYAARVTRGQGVVVRRIGERGHFRSRDKDGGQTIGSAVVENPLL